MVAVDGRRRAGLPSAAHPFRADLPASTSLAPPQAWAPLVRALRFKHPVVVKVAAAHNVSPAQALIRWSLQKGFVCIPKSVSQHRIKENTDVFGFELTADEVKEFDALDEFLGASRPSPRCPGPLPPDADPASALPPLAHSHRLGGLDRGVES